MKARSLPSTTASIKRLGQRTKKGRPGGDLFRNDGRRIRGKSDRICQRFENWNDLRALARPYFLRSTVRESRARKPPFFKTPRRSGSEQGSASEPPSRT